ncbi:hypothetical protein [Pseudolysinimonas sp.]|uniref:hypothetical protein n=1 Tax=Pseudolysinimonas sp. TaxID=2680009 RepID=UPI003F7F03A8
MPTTPRTTRYALTIEDLDRQSGATDNPWTAQLATVDERGRRDDSLAIAFGGTPIEALRSLMEEVERWPEHYDGDADYEDAEAFVKGTKEDQDR